MPLFTPAPIQMDVLTFPGSYAANLATAITAGRAYAMSIFVPPGAQAIVTQMRMILSGSPTGNIDMGIFDATAANGLPGNLLGHTGAILSTTGTFTQNLTATLVLNSGKYWIAFVDTVADTVFLRGSAGTGLAIAVHTTATNLTVLGSTFGAIANDGTCYALLGLTQGGWS